MPRVHMITTLAATAALGMMSSAQAQSMNIRQITRDVGGGVCAPFMENRDMTAAIVAAELLGYRVMDSEPDNREGRQAIIARSPHHRPGSELIMSVGAPR